MTRYRLDDLGWFHFEKLTQSLLKADVGLGVESWGGHNDHGRDAYCSAALRFPDRSAGAVGPFLFQAKFVQGANAAGARWQPLLLKATRAERKLIQRRRGAGYWQDPSHYVLITNCPLSTTAREAITSELSRELPDTEVTLLGESDVCDMLDSHPDLRRSFPEVLSLRDLNALLADAVNRQILERSQAAVEESRDLVPVFVPTLAYHKAWDSLLKHHFVVLDGPPEMGKTAIARTMALSSLLSDWQVIDCRNPDDFFSAYSKGTQQVFVADDAFGRTEYDPTLGRMWERDLPRVFHNLDNRHRLIWTTRKHILERALREMDLTGHAINFPDPGEVIVTADNLSLEEKARILYRHSRAASLDDGLRARVREHASRIVRHQHFTPERIRRFVVDVLPELAERESKGTLNAEDVAREIREAIRNPTDRMRKSFRKLSEVHRWLLIVFLECDGPVEPSQLRTRLVSHRPEISALMFSESLGDLFSAFLKLIPGRHELEGQRVDWIHPSYRDLVIDELRENGDEQVRFLTHASVSGINLALSVAGGSEGTREVPLVTTVAGWEALVRRCCEIAAHGTKYQIPQLLNIVMASLNAQRSEFARANLDSLLRSLCEIASERWNAAEEVLDVGALKAFCLAADRLAPKPELPMINASWESACEQVLAEVESTRVSNAEVVSDWISLALLIEERWPEFAGERTFLDSRARIESAIFECAENEIADGATLEDPDENSAHALRLSELADALSPIDRSMSRTRVITRLQELAQEYEMHGPPDPDDEDYERPGSTADFDIESLFEDL